MKPIPYSVIGAGEQSNLTTAYSGRRSALPLKLSVGGVSTA